MITDRSRRCWIYYMTKTWFEYEVGRVPQSYTNTCHKCRTHKLSYCHLDCETQHTSGWGCILMTTSRIRRCRIRLYKHKCDKDLMWVWTLTNCHKCRSQIPHTLHCHFECETQHTGISGWDCVLMTTIHNRMYWIRLYMYGEDLMWVRSGWRVGCRNHNRTPATSYKKCRTHTLSYCALTVRPGICQAGIASIWPLATVEGAETFYMCMKLTCDEY